MVLLVLIVDETDDGRPRDGFSSILSDFREIQAVGTSMDVRKEVDDGLCGYSAVTLPGGATSRRF